MSSPVPEEGKVASHAECKEVGHENPPDDVTIDKAAEKRLLAKLDLCLTPVLMLVYMSCYLDRSNIGNVKVAGMPEDIGASDSQFSIAVSIFYATYVAFETPLSMLVKKLIPRVLLTFLCVVWSLTTIFSGFSTSVGGLYASRLVLGACEAGLFPSLTLYLTMVYRREEQAKRVAYLFSCAALAGAFGGLLAYALLQMDGIGGKTGWRWAYIIEGVFSIIIAAVVWFGLPTDPTQAWFLTRPERAIMKARQEQTRAYHGGEKFEWSEAKIAFQDPKLYLSGAIQFNQDILLYGFSTFLPSILRGMGYSSLQANYMTIPVYVFGALVFVLVAIASDKYTLRAPFILAANLFGVAGYVLLMTVRSDAVKLFATCLCAVAVYVGPGINVTWLNVNVASFQRRATAIGFQQTMGNTAGIVAGQIYRKSPYILGHGFSLGALLLSQVLIGIKMASIVYMNRKKAYILTGVKDDDRNAKQVTEISNLNTTCNERALKHQSEPVQISIVQDA